MLRKLWWTGCAIVVTAVAGCGTQQTSSTNVGSKTGKPKAELSEAGQATSATNTTSSPNMMEVNQPGSNSANSVAGGTPSASGSPAELIEANWSELQSLVAQHKGKIVVVDLWSTACEPCLKEFPNLIVLHKRYPGDVVAISFDLDYAGIKNKPPAFYTERVRKFLDSQAENTVLHRMCTTPADELFTEIKLDSIPAIYVYGQDGNLARRFEGPSGQGEGVSYEKQVFPFVEELVAASKVEKP